MQTRLSKFADGFVEAGWLLLLTAIPSLALLTAFRSFELPKVAILRSIGLLVLLGWLVRCIESLFLLSGKDRERSVTLSISLDFLQRPLVVPVILFAGSFFLSALASTSRHLSFWGDFGRLQGTYTLAFYVGLFCIVRSRLRTWRQIERLMDVVLLTSFPVAIFAVLQAYGLVPQVWVEAVVAFRDHRAASTLGNPIFLGGYLILVIPFTVMRLYEAATGRRGGAPGMRGLGIGLYAGLLLVQEMGLLVSQSRGPTVAHAVSLLIMALAWATVTGRRRLAFTAIGVAGLGALFIIVLNVSGMPAGPLERVRDATRLLRVLDFRTRVLVWESVASLVGSAGWRWIVGYGPETLAVVLLPHLTPEAATFANALGQHWDRAHNATWEVLGTTGIVGMLAYLILFGALFYYCLRTLGLIAGRSERYLLVTFLGCGALAGAVLPRVALHAWAWAGIGLPAGLLVALGLYVVVRMLMAQPKSRPDLLREQRLGIVLLGAVVAHFVDIQVAFGTTTTQLYFWVFAALVGLCAEKKIGLKAEPLAVSGLRASPPEWPALVVGVLLGTVAISLVLAPGAPLMDALPAILLCLGGTWLLGGALAAIRSGSEGVLASQQAAGQGQSGVSRPLVSYVSVSLLWLGLFVVVFFLSDRIAGSQFAIAAYLFVLVAAMAALAMSLQAGDEHAQPFWRGPAGWTYVLLIVLAVGVIWTINVRPVIADVYFNSGQAYADQRNPGAEIALYLDALKLESDVDIYYLRLSEAYAGLAETATDAQQRNAWFEAAREAAWRAWQLNPEQTYHELNLAHVYLLWAQAAEDPNIRSAALDQAASLYADASRVLRYDPKLFREWGLVLQLQGDREGALAQYRTSLNLDDKQADTYRLLGYLYRDLGKLAEAKQALEQAAKLKPNRVDVYVTLGEIYKSQGRLEEALASAQEAVRLAPRDYRLHLNLGLVYREMGRTDEAAEAVRRALAYAPDDERPHLQTLLSELEGK